MCNLVRAGPTWYGAGAFRHVAGEGCVWGGIRPCVTKHGSADPGMVCFTFFVDCTGVHTSMSHNGEGAQSGLKALYTCTSWYAYAAMFSSSARSQI